MIKNIRLISAGAGSGKTHRLTGELVDFISKEGVRPNAVIATTFTKLAAKELSDRVQKRLMKSGLSRSISTELRSSLIGTVNSVCGRLLTEFCYEGGVSPSIEVMAEEDESLFLNQALSSVLSLESAAKLENLSRKFGIEDYSSMITSLMKNARSNNISCTELKKQASLSLKEQIGYIDPCSKMAPDEITNDFLDALNQGILLCGTLDDSTEKTQKYMERVNKVVQTLEEGLPLPWKEWVFFLKNDPGAKSKVVKELISNQAARVYSHPELHSDIEAFINEVFAVSSQVLEAYQDFKAKRAIMDFVDQEALLLNLLDSASVQQKIKERFDLLMVDEFQDTSPIQLAIFLKLSELVKHTVWVGDPKQSIYGFRGADPELMKAVMNELPKIGNKDIQDTSYRSRPDLVEGANTIFKEAFKNTLSEKQIVLKPNRKDSKEQTCPLKHFDLIKASVKGSKNNAPLRSQNLAFEIANYISEHKKNGVKAGDIAVLFRSNSECIELAQNLSSFDIKVSLSTNGLFETPEGKLAIALLKYLLNPKDLLSKSEIKILCSKDGDSVSVLEERLKKRGEEIAENNSFILSLDKIREEIADLTPLEIFDISVMRTKLDEYFYSWERGEKRLENLNAIRSHIVSYQQHALRLNMALTLPGAILYLDQLNTDEDDTQADSRGEEAVNILTYHRSKGLEWPIVILGSLEAKLKNRAYGVTVLSKTKKFDISNPLNDRYLRLGLNPFGDQVGKTLYETKFQASAIYKKFEEDAIEEDKRLFYVGYTRARDELIFVTSEGKVEWPLRVWSGFTLPEEKKSITILEDIPFHKTDSKVVRKYFPITSQDASYQNRHTSPSDFIGTQGEYNITLASQNQYGARVETMGKLDDALLGDAIHHILCLGPYADIDLIFKNHKLDSLIDKSSFLSNRKVFFEHLKSMFGDFKLVTEVPMKLIEGGQIMSGIADMILETKEGMILIDHKTYQGRDLQKHAEKYKGQLWAYQKMSQGRFVKMYLNYFMQGILLGE